MKHNPGILGSQNLAKIVLYRMLITEINFYLPPDE